MKRSTVRLHWRDRAAAQSFRTGVSLHSHTLHSEESLAFIPRYTASVPVLGRAIRQQEQRYLERTGSALDFARAFWRPPLAPREAYDLEKRQIEERLDLDGLVSLSDHDDIQAGSLLSVVDPRVPISVEWTIPFEPSFFHVGIHNLLPTHAPVIMRELVEFTARPERGRLSELLACLNEFPSTLVVLNHPLWDEARLGAVKHAQLLGRFLERHGEHIHALELNGLRPWKENAQVVWLAEHSGHVLISGGDRHGTEPNANVNLTNAATFAEFVAEIREDGVSDVLIMPQYREPIRLRMIETMWDIVREYPEFPIGRKNWNDRVFYRMKDGSVQPLSALWKGEGPWPVRWFLRGLRAVKSHYVRNALRMALAEPREATL